MKRVDTSMMTKLLRLCQTACLLSLAAMTASGNIDQLRISAIDAMKEGKWDVALVEIDKGIAGYDERAVTKFGSKFGWFWYHKGYCELRLKKWGEAVSSFETCYTKYPNTGEGKMTGNFYEKLSILKQGDAEKGAGNFEKAVELYKKFGAERGPKDKYDKGLYEISLSYCHAKLGNLEISRTHLENAIKYKKASRKSPANGSIMTAFYALAEEAINKKDEETLLAVLKANRAYLALKPVHMYDYAPSFMKLAAQAYKADMKETAMTFYGMIPGDYETADEMKTAVKRLASYEKALREPSGALQKKALSDDLAALEDRARKGEGIDAVLLGAMAYVHEVNGNVRGANAAYRQLEKFHPKRPKREDQFYNLMRTTSMLGEIMEANALGETFLKDYPASKHVDSVRNLMLSSLFAKGNYKECIQVAEASLPKLTPKTEQHDLCLHVLGGSKYFLAEFGDAHDLLKEHQETYGKDSKFAMASLYMYGANLSKLQEWKAASTQLDKYLQEYPTSKDNPYLPFGLFDRANCHYAEEEMAGAQKMIERIGKEFPQSSIADAALNLLGNIHESEKDKLKAEEAYKKAFEQAKTRGNKGVAGEAAFYLVSLMGKEKSPEKLADATTYYDSYWSDYSEGSPYNAQVAVAGMAAMKSVKRGEEALTKLQQVISALARQPGAYGIEEAINSYTEAYLETHTPDQIKDHFYNFPDIDTDDKATRALLSIAVIGVFEDNLKAAKKEKNAAAVTKAQANIKINFRRLDQNFKVQDLSNYILIRVGDYLRKNSASPRNALKYYNEIMGRENQEHRFAAIFGSAEILGASENGAEQDKAISLLEKVYNESEEKAEKEDSLYRIVTTSAKKGDWKAVEERSREYKKKEKRYNKYTAEVSFLLATSFDKRKMVADAHQEFFSLRNTYYGFIKYSAPATKRMMEIVWKRNKPAAGEEKKSDRQLAYEDGWNYVDSTSRLLEKMTDEEKKLWEEVKKLVKQYESSGQIINMAELKKREAEAK